MSRALCLALFLLAFTSMVFADRPNLCLANTLTMKPYKPLQLYPQDCPNNASNCMAAVYNYVAKDFKSDGPKTLIPPVKTSYMYLTQDDSNNIDAVVISNTSYTNNIIKAYLQITGAQPGVNTLVRDDPSTVDNDTWNWNPNTNSGNVTWLLQPGFTDGVVLGHITIVQNFCFRAQMAPNWNGAIGTIAFLTGNVTNPVVAESQKLQNTAVFFEFCQYPQASVTTTGQSCGSMGSATANCLNGTGTYVWKDSTGATFATTATVTGLAAGNYQVEVTEGGCTAYISVTIGMTGGPSISATYVVTNPTKTTAGSIALTLSGGNPPYYITWMNSAGAVVATNTTTLSVTGTDTYTVSITDGCSSQSLTISVTGPGACPPGTMVDGNNCDVCPAGTYSSTPDSAMCTVCPPGTYSTVSNATSCTSCAANMVSGGATGPCTSCPQSTYSASGAGVCIPCPLGQQRASGASSCSACSPGSYRCADQSLCTSCPAGTFSAAGAQTCVSCDPGTYAAAGQSSCTSCGANQYAAMGASSCSSCPSGLSASMGSTVMLACM